MQLIAIVEINQSNRRFKTEDATSTDLPYNFIVTDMECGKEYRILADIRERMLMSSLNDQQMHLFLETSNLKKEGD